MPALSGQTMTTITDATGAPIACITWFFDPTTLALRNNPIAWTDPSGTVWPINSGALIGANLTSHRVTVFVNDAQGNLLRRVRLAANTGNAVKATVLANQAPPDGPYTSALDFNGFTFDTTGTV